MNPLHIFVGAVLTFACISDVRSRRIPNVLTFSAIACALVFHALTDGLSAAGWSLAGCFLGAALFFPMFALRGMGAGDVKLLAAVGAWLGPSQVAMVALAASLAGGVIAIVVALGHGYLRTALKNLWMLLTHWRVMGVRPLEQVTLAGTRGPRLAYAVPISIGTLVTLWLK
jgi:prepilin peptidase CpaA